MSKKILLVVGVVALIAAIGVGSTLAYVTTFTEGVSVVTTGKVQIRVTHNKNEEKQITLIPNVPTDTNSFTVKNTGNYDAYVRVKLTMKNMDFSQFAGNSPAPSVKEQNGWKINDGYAYYPNVVKPGAEVSFIGQITLPAGVDVVTQTDSNRNTTYLKNDFPAEGLKMDVLAEAIQFDHVSKATSGTMNGYPLWPDVEIQSIADTDDQSGGSLTVN